MNWKKQIGVLWDGTTIYLINGDYVRDTFSADFTEGGHHFVYEYVPEGEIWVEEVINKIDQIQNAFHEIFEWNRMKYNGDTYDLAHEKSLSVEKVTRAVHNSEGVTPSGKDEVIPESKSIFSKIYNGVDL